MRKIFSLLILIGCCAGVGKVWYWRTNGFNVCRLYGWTQELKGVWWTREAGEILSQEFHYLGRGRQAFAFESADGQYVLKFPRGDICKLPFWLRALPLEKKRARYRARKAYREKCVLESVELAMVELQESTAMIAMNFSHPQELASKTVKIIDQAGRSFNIPLDTTYFILQKKKRLFKDVIQEAADREGIAGVESVLDALFAVIMERTEKGILNRDGSFLRNYGFDENRAYQTDVGSFYQMKNKPRNEVCFRSMELSVRPIRHWMKSVHPEWLEMLDERREACIQSSYLER